MQLPFLVAGFHFFFYVFRGWRRGALGTNGLTLSFNFLYFSQNALDFLFFLYMKLQTCITYNPNVLYTVAVPLKLQHLIYFEKFPKNISENLPG